MKESLIILTMNNIEQINRIEILGFVGSIRLSNVGDKRLANFTMATNYAFKDKEGHPVIETTWHNVRAFEGEHIGDLDRLERGSTVHVVGRLQVQRYMSAEGIEKTSVTVLAHRVEIVT